MSRVSAAVNKIRRFRTLFVTAAIVSGMSMSCVAAAAPRRIAGQAGRQPWASQIVSPSSSRAVFLGRSTQVVVRLGSGVRSFQAGVGGQTVTGAFRSADGGDSRVATLRVGSTPGLGFGRNTLYVRTSNGRGRRWFTQRSFVLARPVGGLFNTASADAGCGTGAQVRVGLARPQLAVDVRVDGGPPRAIRGGSTRSIDLYANSGLHPGRNVLTVQALDAVRGVYQQRVLRVEMPSTIPVAAAGISRRAKTGRTIQFSAAESVKTAPGQRLVYRWAITGRPSGSRARLQGASSAHPLLRPDRPGRYVVRVTIFEVSAAAASSGRVSSADMLCAADSESVATTTVSAALSAGPMGVPLDTIATTNGGLGVQVGNPNMAGSQFYAVTDRSKALQLVVLNRSTLAEEQNVSYGNDSAGASALLSAVKQLSSSDLVIITKPNTEVTNVADPYHGDATTTATINQALNAIGVSSVSATVATEVGCHPDEEEQVEDSPCSSFSAIGVPGIPVGQGTVNPGFGAPTSATAPGDLHGYLREDLVGTNFTFVNVERVPLDSGDPDANPAVVTIGSDEPGSEVPKTTYTSQKLSGPGFYLLILNAGDLKPEYQVTEPETAQGLHELGLYLAATGSTNPTAMVIVRSIGAVSRPPSGGDSQNWDYVATQLQRLGGSQYLFDALEGKTSSQFAQVGPSGWPGYPSPWTQVATHEHGGSGRLAGLLARNNSSQFYLDDAYPSKLNDPGRPLAGSLAGIMSLPTTAWPDRATTGDQAVLNCVATHIDPNGALRTPIEVNYTNHNLVGNWAAWASTIGGAGYYDTLSGYKDCASFTRADFDEVTDQLRSEWTAVPRVWGLISNLQQPLLDSQGNAAEVGSAAAEVNADVGTSSQSVQYDGWAIASNLLLIVASAPGIDEFAAPLEFMSAGIDLATSLNQNPDGSDAEDDVRTTAADLGASMERKYSADIVGLDETGDILVSDWTKLQLAAQNAANLKNAAADWSWTTTDAKKATQQLLVATRQLAYTTLFPLKYKLYRLQAGAAAGSVNPQDVTSYSCAYFDGYADPNSGEWIYTGAKTWHPFGSAAQFGSVGVTVSGTGATEQWAYATSDNRFVQDKDHAGQLAPAKLLGLMFKTPSNDQYQTAPLFDPLSFALEAYDNATANTQTVTHVNDSVDKFGGGKLTTNLKCK
ncbi:MAG TPA: hypothetical protein VME22_21975 [Solirubrobacteraceae bacterium]|nr:hypothetical protein [Solirubrobacteraceae bacterium]